MANSVDPDQTAPLGAVWSGSALFAQAYLSENLDHYGILKFTYHAMSQNIHVGRSYKITWLSISIWLHSNIIHKFDNLATFF